MINLHIIGRKLRTFGKTLQRCSNWPEISLAKLGLAKSPNLLRFRDGLVLEPMPPLAATWGEIFEPAIADIYEIRNAQPDLIVEVGGNIGAFACFAARTHPAAMVHTFEPSREHSRILEKNVAHNRLSNVTLHQSPVTKDGREVTFSALGTGGGSGLFIHEGGRSTQMQSVSLGCLDFSGAKSLFVKLDCEGAEGEIIEWLCANLPKLPPRIQIAVETHHWCPIPIEQTLEALKSSGFSVRQEILYDEPYLYASIG